MFGYSLYTRSIAVFVANSTTNKIAAFLLERSLLYANFNQLVSIALNVVTNFPLIINQLPFDSLFRQLLVLRSQIKASFQKGIFVCLSVSVFVSPYLRFALSRNTGGPLFGVIHLYSGDASNQEAIFFDH